MFEKYLLKFFDLRLKFGLYKFGLQCLDFARLGYGYGFCLSIFRNKFIRVTY